MAASPADPSHAPPLVFDAASGDDASSPDAATAAWDGNAPTLPLRPPPGSDATDDADAMDDRGGAEWMSLGDHFHELRRRLVAGLFLSVPFLVLGLVFYERLWDLLLLPAHTAMDFMGDVPGDASRYFRLRADSPSQALFVVFRLALYSAGLAVSPGLLYQAWIFVAPGLTATERSALRRIFGAGALLFAFGAMVGWRVAAPVALAFLLPFSAGLSMVENLFSMDDYLSFLVGIAVAFGAACETPLAMWALAKAGLLRSRHLRRWWRPITLGAFVLAAVLTPPEPVSQLLMGGLLMTLFGVGTLLVRWVEPPEDDVPVDGGPSPDVP